VTQAKEKDTSPKAAQAAAAAPRKPCSVEGCKRPYRARSYCRTHYRLWRRGEFGKKHRYKICSHEACRKKRSRGGLCEEHAGTAKAAGAPAA
jgi:hypothetical protein